jgi:hypothetical protein
VVDGSGRRGSQKQIKPSEQDIPVSKFVENLYNYVKGTKIKRWWSRSNTFDPLLLARNFMDHPLMDRDEMHEILPYWLVRDIRTYIDTQFNFLLLVMTSVQSMMKRYGSSTS